MENDSKDLFCETLKKRLEAVSECTERIDIVIAGLRDLEVTNLAEELRLVNGALTDIVWDIEKSIKKTEE